MSKKKDFVGGKRKVEERVYHILQYFPETRDDDNVLLFKYWRVFHMDVFFSEIKNKRLIESKLPQAESITRARRLIQKKAGSGVVPLWMAGNRRLEKKKLEKKNREYYAKR